MSRKKFNEDLAKLLNLQYIYAVDKQDPQLLETGKQLRKAMRKFREDWAPQK